MKKYPKNASSCANFQRVEEHADNFMNQAVQQVQDSLQQISQQVQDNIPAEVQDTAASVQSFAEGVLGSIVSDALQQAAGSVGEQMQATIGDAFGIDSAPVDVDEVQEAIANTDDITKDVGSLQEGLDLAGDAVPAEVQEAVAITNDVAEEVEGLSEGLGVAGDAVPVGEVISTVEEIVEEMPASTVERVQDQARKVFRGLFRG